MRSPTRSNWTTKSFEKVLTSIKAPTFRAPNDGHQLTLRRAIPQLLVATRVAGVINDVSPSGESGE